MSADFGWSTTQPMFLQLGLAGESPAVAEEATTPPLQVSVTSPKPGTWFAYGGPSVVGGATSWNMTLRFIVAGEITLADVEYTGEPCY